MTVHAKDSDLLTEWINTFNELSLGTECRSVLSVYRQLPESVVLGPIGFLGKWIKWNVDYFDHHLHHRSSFTGQMTKSVPFY